MKETAAKLPIVEKDPWLEPVEGELVYRHQRYLDKLLNIEKSCGSIIDYANGHQYFGFHRDQEHDGWWFREWLPGAIDVFIFGDFNQWQRTQLPLSKDSEGVWSIFLSDEHYGTTLIHESRLKMLVHGQNGWLERIPAYIRRVVQDDQTKDYAGQLWAPPAFDWKGDAFDVTTCTSLLIYESHVGMAQEKEDIGTYTEFAKNILPRVKELGYNTIQLMAIAEHPYYGSFGYHVSNFFAPSSRFGTPEELKELIRKAHKMGIAVIMDLVQSHFVKNINEGLNELDGTDHHYSPAGEAGNQPYWDSKLFDYGKDKVTHFLLSNIKYWMEEFHFDGFRFDGVTSMIYYHHGYTEFDAREKFFDDTVNRDALLYLSLANTLIHTLNPHAISIAEDVSGMPGMCIPIDRGGIGFDYRLGMAIPDFWIKLLKEVPDEQWDMWQIWDIMTNRLPDVKTITYAESHDQALVGDKTLAFRLMDKEMYSEMNRSNKNIVVERGMALHKMIRLLTISLGGQAYLDFMGNEFGHPEWIDFPREGNNWSYTHARRQWSLASSPFLRYSQLNEFDIAMIAMVRKYNILKRGYAYNLNIDQANQTMVFSHGDLLFIFNWSPTNSIAEYEIPVNEPGKYMIILDTDAEIFGGQGRDDSSVSHFTYPISQPDNSQRHHMKIYNICRRAVVLRHHK